MAEYKKTDLKTKLDTNFADNSTGAITAKVLRDNLNHIVDSIQPIVASGTDMYFINALDIRDSGITSTSSPINKINSQNTMKETIGDIMKQKGISIKG